MSGPKSDKGLDFASILTQAMTPPEPPSGGREFPDGFPFASPQNYRVVETKDSDGIPGLVDYEFKAHRKVFLTFRPWERCQRCSNDLASEKTALPDDGDYTCPHTALKEYEALMERLLSAKDLYDSEKEYAQKDGTILVSVKWYTRVQKTKNKVTVRPGQKEEPSL